MVSSMTSPGMNGFRYASESPVTTAGGLPLLYQYSSTLSGETGAFDRFLIFRTVTMSLPTFLDGIWMNCMSAVPFKGLMNFAGAAGACCVVAGAALVAGACAPGFAAGACAGLD